MPGVIFFYLLIIKISLNTKIVVKDTKTKINFDHTIVKCLYFCILENDKDKKGREEERKTKGERSKETEQYNPPVLKFEHIYTENLGHPSTLHSSQIQGIDIKKNTLYGE